MNNIQAKSNERIVTLERLVKVNQHKVKRSQAKSEKMKSQLLQMFEAHESLQAYVSQLETSILNLQRNHIETQKASIPRNLHVNGKAKRKF